MFIKLDQIIKSGSISLYVLSLCEEEDYGDTFKLRIGMASSKC